MSSTGPRDVPEFRVQAETGEGTAVVAVCGAVDLAVVGPLWDCVERALEAGRPLVLDLTGVTSIDSNGIALILRAYRWHGDTGSAVTVRTAGPQVRRALALAGIEDLITIEDASTAAAEDTR